MRHREDRQEMATPAPSMRRWASLAVAGVFALVACGDDDSQLQSAGGSDTGVSTADGAQEFCDSFLAATAGFNEEPDSNHGDPEAHGAYVTENVLPHAETAGGVAPDAVAAEVDLLVRSVAEEAETGVPPEEADPDAEERLFAAYAAVQDHLYDSCEADEVVDVELTNYAFVGVPRTLPVADEAYFKLANVSDGTERPELHEVFLGRRNPGTDEPIEELLALDDEVLEKITPMGHELLAPGGRAVMPVALEPGDYLMVCFVPEGASFEDFEGTGPPHALLGMTYEFSVG
jgi:hypothetical protein